MLLKNSTIQELIKSENSSRRGVIKGLTYERLQDLSAVVTKMVAESDSLPVKERCMVLETARRCYETVGRAEGLFIERIHNEGLDNFNANLQRLLQAYMNRKAPALLTGPDPVIVDAETVIEAGAVQPNGSSQQPNGCGESAPPAENPRPTLSDLAQKPQNGNGNGHNPGR
jgi:hypothetical protein